MIPALSLPADLTTDAGTVITLRGARQEDLDAVMALMADDDVSRSRGDLASPADRPAYAAALDALVDDPANALLVVEHEGRVVATLQLTVIPGMARRGATRLLVEAVRVSSSLRSGGIGSAVMRWVTDVAAAATGAALVQLTSDAARVQAHRFYERLGFVGSHVGFKYRIGQA